MFQRLIRDALRRKKLSARGASLNAEVGESYLRDLLDDDEPKNPRIRDILKVARVLDLPIAAIAEAIENDGGYQGTMTKSEEELLTLYRKMDPMQRERWFSEGNDLAEPRSRGPKGRKT